MEPLINAQWKFSDLPHVASFRICPLITDRANMDIT